MKDGGLVRAQYGNFSVLRLPDSRPCERSVWKRPTAVINEDEKIFPARQSSRFGLGKTQASSAADRLAIPFFVGFTWLTLRLLIYFDTD
jgi:hypothetical protein